MRNSLLIGARFSDQAEVVNHRLFSRIKPLELFALLISLSFVGIIAYYRGQGMQPLPGVDYLAFVRAASGDNTGYFYAYWLLPLFQFLGLLPGQMGFAIWAGLNVIGVFLAARIFGGSIAIALLGYQMLFIVYYGQSAGFFVGALALSWWFLVNKRWYLAGFALTIAFSKYQLGIPFGLALLMLADTNWQDRLRVLSVTVAVFALSLIVYPLWPLDLLQVMGKVTPDARSNVSLWGWVGPLTLLLWIPPLIFKMPKGQRIIALVSASALASPYFLQADLIALFVLPVGLIGLLGNLGYFFLGYNWWVLQALSFIPLATYILVLIQGRIVSVPRQEVVEEGG